MEEVVQLRQVNLNTLLNLDNNNLYNLTIPDYQRIYCWEEKNVFRLLDDIQNYTNKHYHMGSIILHKSNKNKSYDIVDGQQRLVTLSLLLMQLNNEIDYSLLNQQFTSEKANEYVAYNKWLIQNYILKNGFLPNLEIIKKNLIFDVLVLTSQTLDLAYTFFTNNNSRGKPLSDFDLLKSHHLRYLLIPEQAEHLASRWDSMILESNNDDNTQALGRTFEIYLFRMRKWMRKKTWDDAQKRKVKNEFEAAPIIPNIPPFGEQFHFYESIQGGAHFFAYAEHYIHCFNEFVKTKPYLVLNKHLNWEKHWWYRDVIEAMLFAYFLKFGTNYINDASILIIRFVSQHRFENFRAYLNSILIFAGNSEIIMMIDQATSPTFFLAEMNMNIKKLPLIPINLKGTRERFKNALYEIENEINETLSILNLTKIYNE